MSTLHNNFYYNLEIERSLLSSLIFLKVEDLRSNEINPLLFLEEKDFYLPNHATLFSIILKLIEKNKAVDEEFIKNELIRLKCQDWEISLLSVISANPIANITPYILEIRKNRMFRELINIKIKIPKYIDENTEASEVINLLNDDLLAISKGDRSHNSTLSASELLRDFENVESVKRVPSNILYFDEMLEGGFDEGGLVIYTGMPESGKTHISYTIAEGASNSNKAGIISVEFGKNDYVNRLKQLIDSDININIDNLDLNFDSYTLPSLLATLYGMSNRGCKLVVIDSLHKIIHNTLTNPTEIINDVANKIDEVCKKTRMSIHLIALASKDDYAGEKMGVLSSATVPHLAKIFFTIHHNSNNGIRTLVWHKNKQTRKLYRQKIKFYDNGRISFTLTGNNQSEKKQRVSLQIK